MIQVDRNLMEQVFAYVMQESKLVVVLFTRDGLIQDCSVFVSRLLGLSTQPRGEFLWQYVERPDWFSHRLPAGPVELVFKLPGGVEMPIFGRLGLVDELYLFTGEGPQDTPQMFKDLSRINDELVGLTRRLSQETAALERAYARAYQQVLTDPLTGLGNRRFLLDYLQKTVGVAQRTPRTLAMAMGDIDDFKRVNDQYGHAVGDRVLQHFARLLRDNCRRDDVVARFGGEEFIIVCQNATAGTAVHCVERLRRLLGETVFEGVPHRITVSFGVTELRPQDRVEDLLKRVDDALYLAKKQGKDQVVVL